MNLDRSLADSAPPALFLVFFVAIMVLGIGGLILWIWALVDCIRVPDDRYYRSGTKLVWVLVIALLQAVGAIVYLAAGRPDKGVRAGWTAVDSPSGSMAAAPSPPAPPGSSGSAQIPPPPPPS